MKTNDKETIKDLKRQIREQKSYIIELQRKRRNIKIKLNNFVAKVYNILDV